MAPTPKVTLGSQYGYTVGNDKNHDSVKATGDWGGSNVIFKDPITLSGAGVNALWSSLSQSARDNMTLNDMVYAVRLYGGTRV